MNDTVSLMQSFNQTEQRLISGIASVDIPFIGNGDDAGVSGIRNDNNASTNSLPWETLSLIQDSWEHLNETDNQTRSFIEAAWEHLNQSELSTPSFAIPIREKRSLVSTQVQDIEKAVFQPPM